VGVGRGFAAQLVRAFNLGKPELIGSGGKPPCGLKIDSGVAARVVSPANEQHVNRSAFRMNQPRDGRAVAAVVPLAADYKRAFVGGGAELLFNRLHGPRGGVFHQQDAGHAVPLCGEAVNLAHLGCREHLHTGDDRRAATGLSKMAGRDLVCVPALTW
jgi:hypothetical protein